MNLLEAAKQALEALYDSVSDNPEWIDKREKSVASLRAAIEEAEKAKPVVWMNPNPRHPEDWFSSFERAGWTTLYTHPAPIPEGFVLVPVAPTPEWISNLVTRGWSSAYRLDATKRKHNELLIRDVIASVPKQEEGK